MSTFHPLLPLAAYFRFRPIADTTAEISLSYSRSDAIDGSLPGRRRANVSSQSGCLGEFPRWASFYFRDGVEPEDPSLLDPTVISRAPWMTWLLVTTYPSL